MSEFPLWVVGVLLVIVGSLGNNLGNNLVSIDHSNKREEEDKKKKEALEEKKKKPDDESSELNLESMEEGNEPGRAIKYKVNSIETQESNASLVIHTENIQKQEPEKKKVSYRITGTIIFIIGNLFTFGAFGFGAQSLLASLESIQFVSNLFFVRFVHKEIVTIRMILATLSIVTGNIMVVVFANHEAILFNSDGMMHLYQTNYAYWGYFVFAISLWFLTNGVYQYYYRSRVVLRKPLLWRHSFFEPFCYACSASIIGTQAVLNSKCMAMLIQVTIRGDQNEFTRWYLWMIFGTWILMVAYWLNRIDTGLKLYPPLFIIPVMQVFFVFYAILCGGIYFREFDEFTTTQWIGFSIGVFLILFGVYGLAPPDLVLVTPDADHPVEEEEEEEKHHHKIRQQSDLEMGPTIAEEKQKKHRILSSSSELADLAMQLDDKDKVRVKPVSAPKISVNSSGVVLVSFDQDNNNNKQVVTQETLIADPVSLPTPNNKNSSSGKIQGVILPPLNRNDSYIAEASLNSSPSSNKKSRKIIKRGTTVNN